MTVHYIKSTDIIIKGIGTHSIWVFRVANLDSFEQKTRIELCGYSSLASYLSNNMNFLATDGCVENTKDMQVQAGSLDPQLLALCIAKMPIFKNSTLEQYEEN